MTPRFGAIRACVLLAGLPLLLILFPIAEAGAADATILRHDRAAAGPTFAARDPVYFDVPGLSSLTNLEAVDVAIGDVTGEGREDVVLTQYEDNAPNQDLAVLPRKPDGTLGNPTLYALDATAQYGSGKIALADLDGDGDTDVAVGVTDGIDILYQGAGGTLGGRRLLTIPTAPGGLVRAIDWDGDAAIELIVSDSLSHFGLHTIFLFDRSVSTWTRTVLTSQELSRWDVAPLADTGNPQLIVAIETGVEVITLTGGELMSDHYALSWPYSIATGRLTADADPDVLILANDGAFLYPGNGDGTLRSPVAFNELASDALIADVNGDGFDDLLNTNTPNSVELHLQHADGSFSSSCHLVERAQDSWRLGAAGDLNGDGRTDIAFTTTNHTFGVLYGATTGASTFDLLLLPPDSTTWNQGVAVIALFDPELACPDTPRYGQTIELRRSDDGGPEVTVASGLTDGSNGRIDLNDPSPPIGSVTYRLRWSGDTLHPASSSAPFTVQVAATTDSLMLQIENDNTLYGDPLQYTATLLPHEVATNQELSIYLQPIGGDEQLIASGPVDPDTGTFTGVIPSVYSNAVIRVAWSGDADWPAASVGETAYVSVRLNPTLSGYVSKQRSVYLYNPKGTVHFTLHVTPKAASSRKVYVEVDRAVFGGWRKWAYANVPVDSLGRVRAYLPAGALKPGVKYRIFAIHRGDPILHLQGNQSESLYFRLK